jgi:hypothetical protein
VQHLQLAHLTLIFFINRIDDGYEHGRLRWLRRDG